MCISGYAITLKAKINNFDFFFELSKIVDFSHWGNHGNQLFTQFIEFYFSYQVVINCNTYICLKK